MEINLSEDMIQSICEVSFARINDLDEKIQLAKANIISNEWRGENDSRIRRSKAFLNQCLQSKEKAQEVHSFFSEISTD